MPLREPFEEKYEILEKIGQGGMGAVYKVRHRLLDELRVIKVIRSPLEPTPEAEERFLREARTACRLRHPNVALLHDFALGEDGRAYIVLEHIEGATLRDLLTGLGVPPLSLALEIGRQAALALQYLHRQRIVHRDISPGNLMLTRDFEGGPLIKLIDLGLAKSLEGGTDGLTQGVFLGKVRYAAPEQFDEGPVDERSDLYSLGVVLYELLTGRSPIAGHDAKSWMAAHLFRPPLDFDESDPEGQVPEDLRALVLRLLAKDPGARLGSAEELAMALRDVQVRFPLRGDELDDVFGGPPVAEQPAEPAVWLDDLDDQDEAAVMDEVEEPALAPPPLREEPSMSLPLRRPSRPVEESVSIPLVLGAGGAARLSDDPSWDAAPARERGEDGLLFEPLDDEMGALPPPVEPRRRSGLLVPVLMGVFSLAIIFTLVALYSVTTEFRLGRADSGTEEVTEPVAPPAEDAQQAQEEQAQPQPDPEPPSVVDTTPLIEEIAGSQEEEPRTVPDEPEPAPAPKPVQIAEKPRVEPAAPPVRTKNTTPKPTPRWVEEPAPAPQTVEKTTEKPDEKIAEEAPRRRTPVVREGGVRPGPGVVPPIPLDMPSYSYPKAARGQGVDIDVRLDLLVDERGKVIEAVVREGDTEGLGFNETALAAARRLSFQPATRGNEPVKMWTEMIFQFSDPEGARRSGR
jgi:serine/threonine-protein kinase